MTTKADLAALIMATHDLLLPSEITEPLTRDCDDWDKIRPALLGWIIATQLAGALNVMHPKWPDAANALSCLTTTIYCMGYERGKRERESESHEWIVKEQEG